MAFPAHKWSEQNYPKRALYYESAFLRFICSSLPTRRPDFPVWQYARELLKLHLPASDWALLARSVCCAPLELNSSAPSFKLSKKLPTGTSFIRNPEILWAFLLLRINLWDFQMSHLPFAAVSVALMLWMTSSPFGLRLVSDFRRISGFPVSPALNDVNKCCWIFVFKVKYS